jgi:hypothetical protein
VKRSGYEMVQPSHCLLPAARKAAEFSEAVRIRRQKPHSKPGLRVARVCELLRTASSRR